MLKHAKNHSQLKRHLLLGAILAAGSFSIIGALRASQRPIVHADTLTTQDSQVRNDHVQTSFNESSQHLLGNGNPANNPNNSTSPNNGQANNSNPNNNDVNNVVTPSYHDDGANNNNNVVSNGSVVNNNDNGTIWYHYHDNDSFFATLASDENNDNQNALNSMNTYYQSQEAAVSSAERNNAATSANIANTKLRDADRAQAVSISDNTELQSLSNEITYNNKKSLMASSAASAKENYMNSLSDNHGYVNSVAQSGLDNIGNDVNLDSSEQHSAVSAIQSQADYYLSVADHSKDATRAKDSLLARIHTICDHADQNDQENQTSNVSKATNSINAEANSLTSFINTFNGISLDQRQNDSDEAQQYLDEANNSININRNNDEALQSAVNTFNINANELEFNAHAESTFDSTSARNSESTAVSSADSALQQNASVAITSLMDNDNYTPAQQDQMEQEVQSSLSSDINSANSDIQSGGSVSIQPMFIKPDNNASDFNVSVPSDNQANTENHADMSYVDPEYDSSEDNFDNEWSAFMQDLDDNIQNQTDSQANNDSSDDEYLPYYNYYDYNSSYDPFYSDLDSLDEYPDYYNDYYNDWNNYANEATVANDNSPENIYDYSNDDYNSYWPDYLDDYSDQNVFY